MDSKTFETGYDVATYVRNLRNYRSVVRTLVEEAKADDEHVAALSGKAASRGGITATMMTEDWCGDAASTLPILSDLFARAGIELRVFRGSENAELKDKYESEGDDHIPVFSLWDSEWNEVARWIEAPASMERKKDAWKAERPEFMELYGRRESDKDAAKEFATLYRGFMDEMIGWYKAGDWDETTREVVEGVS